MEDISRILLLLSFFCCVFMCSSDDSEEILQDLDWNSTDDFWDIDDLFKIPTNDDKWEISDDHVQLKTLCSKFDPDCPKSRGGVGKYGEDIVKPFFKPLSVKTFDDPDGIFSNIDWSTFDFENFDGNWSNLNQINDDKLENSTGKQTNQTNDDKLKNSTDPKENVPLVIVDQSTEWLLRSSLTTVFQPIVYIVVVVVGLPTNVLAVWVFLFRTKKKNPSSIYMANLALADLLFIIWIPLKISYHFNGNDWIYGPGFCKVLVAFFFGNMYCSVLFFTCISVQRYWAVVYPMSQHHRSTCVAACVTLAVWVLVWVCTTPLYLYDQHLYVINLNIHTCHDLILESQSKTMAVFLLTVATLGFLVPSLVCIICSVLTLKALRNTMEDLAIAKKRRKAVVVIVVVLVMFLVCFVPNNLLIMVYSVPLLLDAPEIYPPQLSLITLCLASLNSCLDPFLYYFISHDFREHVKNTFLCRSERTAQRMRVSNPTI